MDVDPVIGSPGFASCKVPNHPHPVAPYPFSQPGFLVPKRFLVDPLDLPFLGMFTCLGTCLAALFGKTPRCSLGA